MSSISPRDPAQTSASDGVRAVVSVGLRPGAMVGRYRVVEPLGQGGMGAVFLAVHQDIGKRAAIKVLDAGLSRDPEMAGRFLNEARAVNRVHHPGLVSIFEYGRLPDGAPYIVMEHLEGESLSSRLRRVGVGLSEAVRLGRQIASTLAAAHERGVVHRDLKPSNVMLVRDPEVPEQERAKVLDFGIAKLTHDEDGPRTRTGAVLGTPAYMAPEQCRAAGEVLDRADVYALGVMLYEMVAGRPPFQAALAFDLMNLQVYGSPPALRALRPAAPAALTELVHAMLSKDPAQRPTMSGVAAALQRVLDAGLTAERVAQLATPAPVTAATLDGALDEAAPPGLGAPTLPSRPVVAAVAVEPGPGPGRVRRPLGVVAAVVLALGALAFGVSALRGRPGPPRPESAAVAPVQTSPAPASAAPAPVAAPAALPPASAAPAAPTAASRPAAPSRPASRRPPARLKNQDIPMLP